MDKGVSLEEQRSYTVEGQWRTTTGLSSQRHVNSLERSMLEAMHLDLIP